MKILDTDILVVGGGTAGIIAAFVAAEEGVTVTVAECSRGLGGVGTHAGIHAYYLGLHVGLQPEMDRRTRDIGKELGGTVKGFHAEAKKTAIQERLAASGIRVLYDCVAVEVILADRRVAGVLFESPEGPIRVNAGLTLDSTGNGDVCALAGVPFTKGREWDEVMQAYSVVPRYFKGDEKIDDFKNYDAGWVDSSSTRDVSRALLEGRQLIRRLPEMQENNIFSISSHFGAREGRQIRGEYVLGLEDLILDRRFDDVVMKCYSHYDNHATDMANESRLAQIWTAVVGAWSFRLGCDVPYRSFVPIEIDGLLIACRALSVNHDASGAVRMQPDMHAVGEVAGTAAALCLHTGRQPREVDVPELQRRLIKRGVLTESDLSRPSAPWVTLSGSKRGGGEWTLDTVVLPDRLRMLLDAMGTEEEGKALWWIWKAGDTALPVLRERFAAAQGLPRRGIALALALLGDRSGVPELKRSVIDRDEDGLPGVEPRIPPRWIACLLGLQMLREASCADILLDRLPPTKPTVRLTAYAEILHVLHYVIEVADLLGPTQQHKAVRVIGELLRLPLLGDDWVSGGGMADVQKEVSIRWNIEMTGAFALCILGERKGLERLENYLHDRRIFVRNMAHVLLERLACQTFTDDVEAVKRA
ncbi:MAG: hypothetical protein K0R28_831 [Paenibacillus sp.]|nr:hypothetical protein [Paenibacillus sp.]